MLRKMLFFLCLGGILTLAACAANPANPIATPDFSNPADATPTSKMANPASLYCEQNGGRLELRQDASGGVSGVCIFPDGSECDEWAYYRKECQPGDSLAKPTLNPVSAGGLQIVYLKDGKVMLWSEGNQPRPLAEASTEQIHISDDGQLVAYLGANSEGESGLFSVGMDGKPALFLAAWETLLNHRTEGLVTFDFAPGSHMLYVVTEQYDLQRIDADTGGLEALFEAGKGGFFSFSPDGQWMTLYHPDELVLAKPDGSSARSVFQFLPDYRCSNCAPEIVWKADSSGFSLASPTGQPDEVDGMSLWFVQLEGQPVRQMSWTGPYGAELSPDGQSVVYLNFKNDPVDVHIVTEGGKDTIYASYPSKTFPAVNFLGWRPDSSAFLLNLSGDARNPLPYLCASGKEPVKLTDTEFAYPITWVDNERFLFVSEGSLRVETPGQPSLELDAVSGSYFDFANINP